MNKLQKNKIELYVIHTLHIVFTVLVLYWILTNKDKTVIDWIITFVAIFGTAFFVDVWKKRWLEKDWNDRKEVISDLLTEEKDK